MTLTLVRVLGGIALLNAAWTVYRSVREPTARHRAERYMALGLVCIVVPRALTGNTAALIALGALGFLQLAIGAVLIRRSPPVPPATPLRGGR